MDIADRQPVWLCQAISTHKHHPGETQQGVPGGRAGGCRGRDSNICTHKSLIFKVIFRCYNIITMVTLQSTSLTDQNDCASTGHKNLLIKLFHILPKRRGQI